VKRGLAEKPEDWKWSSFRSYASGEEGLVKVYCQEWPLRITYSASRDFPVIVSLLRCSISLKGLKG